MPKNSRVRGEEAVIYCRVSSDKQVAGHSLDEQRDVCLSFCRENKWPVAKMFREEGESAKSVDRPEFQRMLALCKACAQIRYLVVYELSRFSRRAGDQACLIAELGALGVLVRSARENVDESPAGKLLGNLMGAVNQFDNDNKAVRTTSGMQSAARLGTFPFKAPLGYLNANARTGSSLSLDPQRAELVKTGFELYATGRYTRADVLRQITKQGLTTHKGTPVSIQSFQKMLRNPVYAGRVSIPTWGINSKGRFDPIVSEATFEKVQAIAAGKGVQFTTHNRQNPDYPLRRFVRCRCCGLPLTGSASKGCAGKHYAYYHCRGEGCKTRASKAKLEQLFIELLQELKPNFSYRQLFQDTVRDLWNQRLRDVRAEQRDARQKQTSIGERKNLLVDALLAQKIDQQTYDAQCRRLDADAAEAAGRLQSAEMEDFDVELLLRFAATMLERPAELWFDAPVDQKQRLQAVFFPSGLDYAPEAFGTDPSATFFKALEPISGTDERVVRPERFELPAFWFVARRSIQLS